MIAALVFVLITLVYCAPAFQGKVLSQSDTMQWKGMAHTLKEYNETADVPANWTNSMFSGMPSYQITVKNPGNPVTADLNGLKDYMLKVFPTNPYEKIVLPVVACRESEFINCISAIYMSSSYRGALEDENKLQVASVKREETYKKQDKYDELKDEL